MSSYLELEIVSEGRGDNEKIRVIRGQDSGKGFKRKS